MSRAYALLGTQHHDRLNLYINGSLQEQQLTWNLGFSGTPDIVEPDHAVQGSYILTDYKSYGSFRVGKMLGMKSRKEAHPTEVYKRAGKWGKVGDPKTVTIWEEDPTLADCSDEEIQLNGYRLILESNGYPISRMQIQATVRDGGLQIARERGIVKPMYMIPIRKLDDVGVISYFQTKKADWQSASVTGQEPPPCNDVESWSKRKCKDYCEVREFCSQGIMLATQEVS